MPFQNRVSPFGSLHAVPERGGMLGNRGGRFHRDDGTLKPRHFASIHWIACELHYRGLHHDVMGKGYTSLFFLDDVTALAGGHRPCCLCRRAEALAFLDGERVAAVDAQAHRERLGPRPLVDTQELPDGAMIAADGRAFAARGAWFLPWSFAGYGPAVARRAIMRAELLTPASFLARLHRGYQPRWHETALQERG